MQTRREVLRTMAGAASVGALVSPFFAWAQQQTETGVATQRGKGKRILFFTKSQGFAHEAVTRKPKPDGTPGDQLAWGEKYFKEWASAAGYEVEVSKDGGIFTAENIARFDAFVFYTDGDLTKPPANQTCDQTPAMTAEGKQALLKAIEEGKGFVGLHSASATFRNASRANDPVRLAPADAKVDPYCAMIGAEFTNHGAQQPATIRVASKAFPGLMDLKEFRMTEEWYAFTNLAQDLHVILVQDTSTMTVSARSGLRDAPYRGEPYPGTWARMHVKGCVFYTSLGHRQDVWTDPLYQKIVLAALAWTTGVVKGEVPPNVKEVCPGIAKA